MIYPWIEVVNRGSPTVARLQSVSIRLPIGALLPIQQVLPGVTDFANETTGMKVKLDPQHHFARKAGEKPITRGGAVQGWIGIATPITREELKNSQAMLTIKFLDVNDKPYSINLNFGDCSEDERIYNPDSRVKPQ